MLKTRTHQQLPTRFTTAPFNKTYLKLLGQLKPILYSPKIQWNKTMTLYSRLFRLCKYGNAFNDRPYICKRMALIPDMDWDTIMAPNANYNVIYILASPLYKRSYVGSTQHPYQRMQQHIRKSIHPNRSNKELRRRGTGQYVYQEIHKSQPHTWMILPIAIVTDFPPTKHYRHLIKQIEDGYIATLNPQLNSMNAKHRLIGRSRKIAISLALTHRNNDRNLGTNSIQKLAARKQRKQHRNKGLSPDLHDTQPIYANGTDPVTTLTLSALKDTPTPEVITQTAYSLKKILTEIHRSHTKHGPFPQTRHGLYIFWQRGRIDLNDWRFTATHFGTSKILFGDQISTLQDTIPKMKTEASGTFRLIQVTRTSAPRIKLVRSIERIVHSQNNVWLAHAFITYDFGDLLMMRISATRITDRDTQTLACNAIDAALQYKFKYKVKLNLTLRTTFSPCLGVRRINSMIKGIIAHANIPTAIKRFFLQPKTIRVVYTKSQSIRAITSNYKQKICNTFHPERPPACTCHDNKLLSSILPDSAYRSGPVDDLHSEKQKHIAFKSTEFKGLFYKPKTNYKPTACTSTRWRGWSA